MEHVVNRLSKSLNQEQLSYLQMVLSSEFHESSKAFFDEDIIEGIFSMAKTQYDAKQYEHAYNLCALLTMVDEHDARFPIGEADCLFKMERYYEAYEAYKRSIRIDKTDPTPVYQAARCLINMDCHREALEILKLLRDAKMQNSEVRKESYLNCIRLKKTLEHNERAAIFGRSPEDEKKKKSLLRNLFAAQA